MYDDNGGSGFGGLGNSLGNFFSNPMTLAAIQMMGNNTPKINAIPNTLEGVPTVLMSAQDRQRKAAEDARQRQLDAAKQAAMVEALKYGDVPEGVAQRLAPSLPAVQTFQGYQKQKREANELNSYENGQQPPAAPFAPTPAAPAAAAQPDNAMQQALANASSKFDDFGRSSVGKTVGEVADALGKDNKTAQAGFLNAARNQGMAPEALLTDKMLSNPDVAMPLAKSIGVGADLPDDQWRQAHAAAFQANKAQQAARAAAQQAAQQQSAQQDGPTIPFPNMSFTQTGASPNGPGSTQPAPVQPTPQQPAPQQQTPAPPQTATDRALAVREQKRVEELQAKIDYNRRFLGSPNPRVKAAATEAVHAARQELAQKPQFTKIGEDAMQRPQMGFVHPDGTVTPYHLPKESQTATEDNHETYPGDTLEERLQSVPAHERNQLRGMIEGRSAPPTSFARSKPYWQDLINKANRLDPDGFDESKWASRVATRKDFDSGKTAGNLISMGQTYGHFDKLTDAVDKLDNTNFPAINSVKNSALNQTGSDKASNLRTVAKGVAAEVGRVFKVVGVVGEKETKEWEKNLDVNMSPEQLKGSVGVLLDMIDSRVQEQGARWDRQFPNEPRELYSPNAKKKLEEVRAWVDSKPNAPAPRRTGRYPGTGGGPMPGNYTYDPNTRQMVPQQ